MKLQEIEALAARAGADGAQVAAVLGLGFVGSAVAAALTQPTGPGRFCVIGIELDTPEGRRKAAELDAGRPPVLAQDASLAAALEQAVHAPRRLCATTDAAALALADVVLVCVAVDLVRESGQTEQLGCRLEGAARALELVGERLRAGALVVVESTLPLGASEKVLYPALCAGAARAGRDVAADPPLYAYCYERVTPGPNYLASVHGTRRSFAGIDARSAVRMRAFLGALSDTQRHPPWEHATPRAAEMAKLLENAYRATNIAFIDEWARLAERAGIDLFDVVRSIRVRTGTHDNMMLPGLGVGGYCLTKDALLAAWGAESLLGIEAELPFSRRAMLVNEGMPLRVVRAAERHFGARLSGLQAAVLGVTYREGVDDTRQSPSETLVRALLERGVRVRLHDSLARSWPELPELPLLETPEEALEGARLVVVSLPDPLFTQRLPALLTQRLGQGDLLADPWNTVAPRCAAALAERGVEVFVYGRGDLPKARSAHA